MIMKMFFALFFCCTVFGGNLAVPLAFDSGQVLPLGVRNLRYNYLMGGANNKFNSEGAVVGVGNVMNVDVTYQQFVDGQDTAVERGILEGYLQRHGKDMASVAGATTGVVSVAVDAQVPILAWGITPQWTAAVVIPVVRVRTRVDTGFVAGASLQQLADQLVNEGREFKAEEVRDKTNGAIEDKNDKYGYETITQALPREETSLGDIRLINKIQVAKKAKYALTLMQELALPTGRVADLQRAVDVPTGDGQFDLGVGAIAEYYPRSWVTLWGRLSYTWQIADRVARRVPENGNSSLSPDIDAQVSRDLGDSVYLSAGAVAGLYGGIKFKTQYSFQYKQRDRYQGSEYPAHRYGFLGKDSEQSIHALQWGLNYSTIESYRKQQFPLPLDFNVMMGIPLAGKNVVEDTSVVAEAAVFF